MDRNARFVRCEGGTYDKARVLNQRTVLDAILNGIHRVIQERVVRCIVCWVGDWFDLCVVSPIRRDGERALSQVCKVCQCLEDFG